MNELEPIRVFLCGDVMTGRGVDQILPFPGDPTLHESYLKDARRYVELAEAANGAIPRPLGWNYIWGDALEELDRARVDVRIINLETSITRSDDYWRDKGIHYRMHPRNVGCITAARINCCCLANNHVLDWGYAGLTETLQTLDEVGVAHAGAGKNAEEAAAPAILSIPGKGRVLVFSFGSPSSGIPQEWSATRTRAGINFLDDLSEENASRLAKEMRGYKRDGDLIVASIHWGPNWGYELSRKEIRFAHRLVDEGVAIVHGHSSHHVKATEIYNNRLVLYGCGDFLNDYEGISGYEEYRSNLTLMYLATLDPLDSRLVGTRLIPMRVARFRLNRVARTDAEWLRDLLSKLGASFSTRFDLAPDNSIVPRPA